MTAANPNHAGYQATGRIGGGLEHKINDALNRLETIPLADRGDLWCVAWGGARRAYELHLEGRRAKAGKVLADANKIIEEIFS